MLVEGAGSYCQMAQDSTSSLCMWRARRGKSRWQAHQGEDVTSLPLFHGASLHYCFVLFILAGDSDPGRLCGCGTRVIREDRGGLLLKTAHRTHNPCPFHLPRRSQHKAQKVELIHCPVALGQQSVV